MHSQADRRDLESLRMRGPALLVLQPPGKGFGKPIDKEQAKSRLALRGNTLLFFGLIRRCKGLPVLLEAMPLVLRKLDCTLLTAGEFYDGKERCLNLVLTLMPMGVPKAHEVLRGAKRRSTPAIVEARTARLPRSRWSLAMTSM